MTGSEPCSVNLGDCFEIWENCVAVGSVDMVLIDPPYGGIVSDSYDRIDEGACLDMLLNLSRLAESALIDGGTCYIFGGIGKFKNRPFLKFLSTVEERTGLKLHNVLTWKKRRGYGTQYNYMFTREEIAMLIKGDRPRYFKVQRTSETRSVGWKRRLVSAKYRPLSENMRVSNVITHINELFRGKLCTAEKPAALYHMLISASCPVGGIVLDPMCGSGTTMVAAANAGVRSVLIDIDSDMIEITKAR